MPRRLTGLGIRQGLYDEDMIHDRGQAIVEAMWTDHLAKLPVTGDQDEAGAALVDLAGRIMLTHGIDPVMPRGCSASRVPKRRHDPARSAVVASGYRSRGAARLFINILMRLEWRLNHDSRAIRHALDLPLDTLGGAAPADRLGGSLEDLRELRGAIDSVAAPTIKWCGSVTVRPPEWRR